MVSGALAAGVVTLAFVDAAALGAQQVRSSAVLSGVRVRYADALEATALTLSPSVIATGSRAVGGASATLSRPSVGPWSAQGQVMGSYFMQSDAPVSGEVAGTLGGSSAGDGARTGQAQLLARAHLTGATRGAWGGAGVGTAWNGVGWQGTRLVELGAWWQGAHFGLVATHTPTVANDSVRYADTQLLLRWRAARAELDGTLGHRGGRAGSAGVDDPDAWASVSASLRLSPRLALVASGGTYPLDLLQGFASGRFASVGLRITGPGSGDGPEFARSAREVARERLVRDGLGAMTVRRLRAGGYELRLRASGAGRVELTGDLTGWAPVTMRAEPDGWWSLRVDAAPGTHEVTVRRDGRAWIAPPGLPERRDEFGGVSGIVSLP